MNNLTRIALATLVALALGACAKKTKEAPPPFEERETVTRTEAVVDDGRYSPGDLDSDSCLRQRVVYFDFDMSNIKPEFTEILRCHGKYLSDRPSSRVTLESHADERGSREYNLGLGERRGNAVSDSLMANGGSAGQQTVVSYGEERPVCMDSYESCWAQNRRVEIIYTAK
ncbi:MAG TPA: peptidoglycan-associated lipoprotein Pal [Xanthomonadaceae bacterium]|nr:peptidoglycan-associated lipoprotein Pal [Xanthomonadaceae bacterium]